MSSDSSSNSSNSSSKSNNNNDNICISSESQGHTSRLRRRRLIKNIRRRYIPYTTNTPREHENILIVNEFLTGFTPFY